MRHPEGVKPSDSPLRAPVEHDADLTALPEVRLETLRRRSTLTPRLGPALLLAATVLPACASTARVGQFHAFAEAGVAYVDAADAFLDEAGDAAVDADSRLLMVARERLPDSANRTRSLLDSNSLLRERLNLLSDLRRHGQLLRAYFLALAALAESDRPAEIGEATREIVDALGRLDERIRAARVGGARVGEFAAGVTELAVATFRRAALDRELEAHADLIARELDLQEAAMRAVAGQLHADLAIVLAGLETTEVVRPFAGTRQLPRRWPDSRREILRAGQAIESADAAADAAARLRRAFVALAEDRLGTADLQPLVADVDRIVDLIERVARPKTG